MVKLVVENSVPLDDYPLLHHMLLLQVNHPRQHCVVWGLRGPYTTMKFSLSQDEFGPLRLGFCVCGLLQKRKTAIWYVYERMCESEL